MLLHGPELLLHQAALVFAPLVVHHVLVFAPKCLMLMKCAVSDVCCLLPAGTPISHGGRADIVGLLKFLQVPHIPTGRYNTRLFGVVRCSCAFLSACMCTAWSSMCVCVSFSVAAIMSMYDTFSTMFVC